jgi:hypothetical protein
MYDGANGHRRAEVATMAAGADAGGLRRGGVEIGSRTRKRSMSDRRPNGVRL